MSSLQGSVARLGKEIRSLHPHIQVPYAINICVQCLFIFFIHSHCSMVQDAKKLKDAVTALCARHGGGGVGGVGDEEQQEVDTEKSEVLPD